MIFAFFGVLSLVVNSCPVESFAKDERILVGILMEELPDLDVSFARRLVSALEREGYEVDEMGTDELAEPKIVSASRIGMLIIPSIRTFPLKALPSLEGYLRDGGTLIALGRQPFERIVCRSNERWITVEEALSTVKPTHYLFELTPSEISRWSRATSNPKSGWRWDIVQDVPQSLRRALRVEIEDLRGWDVLSPPPFEESPFSEGDTLTSLWAKSSKPNQWITVEWRERDGSRWIAAIELTTRWRRYVLRPEEFRFWRDGSPASRGGRGDRFHPENAYRFAFGPAASHGQQEFGRFTYWIAGLSVAKTPFDTEVKPPKLEMLYPWYKHYECSGVNESRATRWQKVTSEGFKIKGIGEFTSPIWRPRGLNYVNPPPGRWIPILEAYDGEGEPRGTLASIFLSLSEPFPNAAWAYIGVDPSELPDDQRDRIERLVLDVARWLSHGVHLAAAGASQFGYFTEQKIRIGARIINRHPVLQNVSLEASLLRRGSEGGIWRWSERLEIAPATVVTVERELDEQVEEDEYEAIVRLKVDGHTVDEIRQPVTVISERKPRPENLVTVSDGEFLLGGKRWYAHGINFWPLYVAGMEPRHYFLHWLHPMNYDPVAVERDLRLLKSLGMNMISIQYGGLASWHSLVDLLRRCERLGIKVNLFISGAHPLGFNEEEVRNQILNARLWQWESLFAYDIAWEPRVGDYARRRRLDPLWREWLIEQYGSVENAERDWNFRANRDEKGLITAPSDEQILNDGDWRIMVAAYRRFIDDMLSRRLNRITRLIRRLDPNHLIGFRAGWGGTGQPHADRFMPFDLLSGAKHLDFISPEGYGLPPEWERARDTGFVTLYARLAGNGKPVYWSEYGASIYPNTSPERIEHQRRIWESMYRVVLDSWANGSAGWWFPGGYRVDENSDFGVIGPDRRPRPAAQMAREFAPKLLDPNSHVPDEADVWITIDRDLHPRGFSQVWARHREEYIESRKRGKVVELRTEGTGRTSLDVPLVAVGNVPCNSHNPPKFLNAEFNRVEVFLGEEWVELVKGATVKVKRGSKLVARISVGNTGDAIWIAPSNADGRPGAVYLAISIDDQPADLIPIGEDVPRYGDLTLNDVTIIRRVEDDVKVDLRMIANGRTGFGERFTFRIENH
jgi:hypothetical protein